MDEVRIWDDARTQAEIKANMYAELTGSENNLVAYYNMNAGSGTSLADNSSNSYTGTLTNMDGNTDWVSAPLYAQNYGLDFDGTDDYVSIPAINLNSDIITIELWIKPDEIDAYKGILTTRDGTSIAGLYMESDGDIDYNWNEDSNTYGHDFGTGVRLVAGEWNHIALVISDTQVEVYRNGVASGNPHSYNNPSEAWDGELRVGDDDVTSNRHFDGKLDEVRIWDDVRSQAEIQANMYSELTGSESNLVAYYNFNVGRGASLLDLTTNNNMGTLTNMSSSSDWVSGFELGVTISGNSGFRMMSSPVAGQVYSDLLSELWTQGMTGADATSGTANVWTYSTAGQSWSALTNISTASQTAGAGFLVYVYQDGNNDGDTSDDADLPVTLSVSGTENSSSATVGSIASGNWALAGNPYASTIDWDNVTKTYLATSAYVWDSQAGTPAYVSWNGSAGSLTDGLIAPYQGFWIQASGGTGSLTIETADKSGTAGTFYRTLESENTGSISFNISSGSLTDKTYISFRDDGDSGIDIADGYKLLPLSPTERVIGLSFIEENGLDINNLPFEGEGSIEIPFDVMKLTVDEDYNFVTNEDEVTLTWDLSKLPETILNLILTNNVTGEVTNLLLENELAFFTQSKGFFPAYGTETVNKYSEVGESLFTLTIEYSALSAESDLMPKEFVLHPVYPNPFNPVTTLRYDLPENGLVNIIIYDMLGRQVKTLVNQTQDAGYRSVVWDATNDYGKPVSAGIYLCQIQAGEYISTKKMVLLK